MKSKDWHFVEKIFHRALALDNDQRAAYLERACGGNILLRQEIESLVCSYEEAQERRFLDFSLFNKRFSTIWKN